MVVGRSSRCSAERIQELQRRITVASTVSPTVTVTPAPTATATAMASSSPAAESQQARELASLRLRVRSLEASHKLLLEDRCASLAAAADRADPQDPQGAALRLSAEVVRQLTSEKAELEATVCRLQAEIAKQTTAAHEVKASARRSSAALSSSSSSSRTLATAPNSLPSSSSSSATADSSAFSASSSSSSSSASSTSVAACGPVSQLNDSLLAAATEDMLTDGISCGKSVALEYTEDTPFFRSQLVRLESRVHNFGNVLKTVTKSAGDLCQAGTLFSQACGNLAQELSAEFTELERADEKTSVGGAVCALSELLAHVQSIGSHLVLSFDTLMVQALFDFRQRHIKACKDSSRLLAKATEEYEAALLHHLGQRIPKTGHSTPSFFSRSKKEPNEAELQEQVNNLRRRFELSRFDHVRCLSELQSQHMAEVVELLCASFFGLVTFFHEGEYVAQSLKPELEDLNVQVQTRRSEHSLQRKRFSEQRDKLERGLSSPAFSVADAFPPTLENAGTEREFATVRGKKARVEKQGYLLKQSSNMKKDWKRRWFALRDGQLFYFRSEEVRRTPVGLCSPEVFFVLLFRCCYLYSC